MKLSHLKRNLKNSHLSIEADSTWKKNTKEALLAHIRTTDSWKYAYTKEAPSLSVRLHAVFSAHVLRPVIATFLVVAVIFSSSALTVQAAQASLPGDTLYTVKIGFERVQVGFAVGEEKKAALEISFAGTRVEEVEKLVQEKAGQSAEIGTAVKQLQKDLASVQKRLEKIGNAKETPQKNDSVLEISKLVNEKTDEIEQNLQDIKNEIVQKEITAEEKLVQYYEKVAAEKAVEKTLSDENESDIATEESVKNVDTVIPQEEQTVLDEVTATQNKGIQLLDVLDGAIESVDSANTKSLEVFVAGASASGNEGVKQEAVQKIQKKVEKIEKAIVATEGKIEKISVTSEKTVLNEMSIELSTEVPIEELDTDNEEKENTDTSKKTESVVSTSTPEILTSGSSKTASTTNAHMGKTILKESTVQIQKAITETKDKPKQAKDTIAEVKKLLDENQTNDLSAAIAKVKEANDIVKKVDETIKSVETSIKKAVIDAEDDLIKSEALLEEDTTEKDTIKDNGEVLGDSVQSNDTVGTSTDEQVDINEEEEKNV